jgi:hypothetical protein
MSSTHEPGNVCKRSFRLFSPASSGVDSAKYAFDIVAGWSMCPIHKSKGADGVNGAWLKLSRELP